MNKSEKEEEWIVTTPHGVVHYKIKKPMFPYGCVYCNRENVTSSAGGSCGRSACNDAWREAHKGDDKWDKAKRV